MRCTTVRVGLVAALLTLAGSRAEAGLFQLDFTGKVNSTNNPVFGLNFQIGDAVTGQLVYDTGVPGTPAGSDVTGYPQSQPFTVAVNGHTFLSQGLDTLAIADNFNGKDVFQATSNNLALDGTGVPGGNMQLNLNDKSQTAFSNTQLPTTLDLASFDDRVGVINDTANHTGFQFSVDTLSLSPVPTAVPEPSTLALLAIGGLSLLGCQWRRRRKDA